MAGCHRRVDPEASRRIEGLALAVGADVLGWATRLLDDIGRAYAQVPDDVRSILNRTIFERVYLDEFGTALGSNVTDPFAEILAAGTMTNQREASNSKRPDPKTGASDVASLTDVLVRSREKICAVSSTAVMADVLERHSKLGSTGVRVAKAAELARQDRRSEAWVSPKVTVTTVRRMTPEEVETMVADYRSGIGSYRLAKKYGVSDSTVLARLKAAGVEINSSSQVEERHRMTEEMYRLRKSGHTLAEIGKRYGITGQAASTRLGRQSDRA